MATSVELARAMAPALGLTEKAVLLHLKHARASKAVTFAGHGRSAATMSAIDAARLLIAVAGSPHAADAAASVDRFAGLRRLGGRDPSATLDRALEYVINSLRARSMARNISPETEFAGRPDVLVEAALKLIWVEGDAAGEFPRVAVLRYPRPSGRGSADETFASQALPRRYYDEARLLSEFAGARMTTTRTVSLNALIDIARFLAGSTDGPRPP